MIFNPRWQSSINALLNESSGFFGLGIMLLFVCLLLLAVFLVRRRQPLNVLVAYAIFAVLPASIGLWGTAAMGANALFYASNPVAWGAGEPTSLFVLGGRAFIPLYLGSIASAFCLLIAALLLLFRVHRA